MFEFLRNLLIPLEKLGVNTTRMKWKLFQWEKKLGRAQDKSFVPTRFQWMRWRHKTCFKCGAIVAREDSTCPKCGAHIPAIAVYRLRRLFGTLLPENAPVTVGAFMLLMFIVFAGNIAMQGYSALGGPTGLTLYVFGGFSTEWAINNKEYWRILTFGIEHIGAIHIAFNSYALLQVGPIVENMLGRLRMLVLITFTQLTAAYGTYFWYHTMQHSDLTPTAGASGWLFGLIGFGIGALWSHVGAAQAYRNTLIQWAIYSLIFGYIMHANNAAHVGGLIGGMVLGVIPEPNVRAMNSAKPIWTAAAVISAILWVVCCAYLAHSIFTHWTPGGMIDQDL